MQPLMTNSKELNPIQKALNKNQTSSAQLQNPSRIQKTQTNKNQNKLSQEYPHIAITTIQLLNSAYNN